MADVVVHGAAIDAQTRCVHWSSPLDVVAIEFACCRRFYPCHSCHEADADHPARPWPADALDEPAVLCGVCGARLTITDYVEGDDACPRCGTGFNPGCRLHHDLYFS